MILLGGLSGRAGELVGTAVYVWSIQDELVLIQRLGCYKAGAT